MVHELVNPEIPSAFRVVSLLSPPQLPYIIIIPGESEITLALVAVELDWAGHSIGGEKATCEEDEEDDLSLPLEARPAETSSIGRP